MRALLSVYDKTGLEDFARGLSKLGWELVSSGGTEKALKAAGIPVMPVESVTGFPEMMDGRVKTIHPKIEGAILADRSKPEHLEAAAKHSMTLIDLVVCNLYPFQAKPSIEMIDVGGPTMVRAAAKNHASVGVVVDPADYAELLEDLQSHGELSDYTRRNLARKAFAHTAAYDAAIVTWFDRGDPLPPSIHIAADLVAQSKYGENAWQTPAGLYTTRSGDELAVDQLELQAGNAPSFNNQAEFDRQLQTVTHLAAGFELNFSQVPCIAIGTKHGNPCGAAVIGDTAKAIKDMVVGDKRAIFGGLVMTNFPVDDELAEALLSYESEGRRILDAITAPSFSAGAVELLKRKGDKCRFLINPALRTASSSLDRGRRVRQVRGGFLVQPNYTYVMSLKDPELVKIGEATDQQARDMVMAWAIGSTSNSNTVTLVKDGQLIGNGVGQQDRVSCCELAFKRARDAGHDVEGSVAFSDSFFPFEDGPETLADAGVKAIWAPVAGLRAEKVQAVCRDRGVVLYQVPDAKGRGFFGH